jgi:tetratricopeptide (TPR) repeat protein
MPLWTGRRLAYSTVQKTGAAALRDSLMARLDRLSLVKEIAQIGAVIGHEFSYELIAAVAPHSKPELDEALAKLTASGLAFCQGRPPNAVYSFKHALVHDAAYDSLLTTRRQALHAKIASAIEQRHPAVKETEPELLAHHYTEAKQFHKAIPLWHKAGKLAHKRVALAEGISDLERGLELIAALPQSMERDGYEIDLRTILGTAWMAFKGWLCQEVWDSLHPALVLAHSLRRTDALLPILSGLWSNVLNRGRAAESLHWVEQTLNVAEAYGGPDLLILGHRAAMASYFYLGELTKTREHADQVLSLYDDRQHVHLVQILNQDQRTESLSLKARALWMLGYPDQALKVDETAQTHAPARTRVRPRVGLNDERAAFRLPSRTRRAKEAHLGSGTSWA